MHKGKTKSYTIPLVGLLAALLVFVPSIATGLSAPATTPGSETDPVQPDGPEDLDPRMKTLTSNLSGPWPPETLQAAVEASARLADVETEPIKPEPFETDIPLPDDLQKPVTQLLGAIAATEPLTRQSVRPEHHARLIELQAMLEKSPTIQAGEPFEQPSWPTIEHLEEVRTLVDQQAQYTAALTLARAIDQALAALHDATGPASTLSVPSHVVDGCDIVDALPLLCIGSEASNVYKQDAVLLVDLGGDDLHLHGAGAGDTLAGRPVSLSIDLGGNDRYEAPRSGVHGSAALGAIGILVDEGGDDAYVARATGDQASMNAQANAVTGAVGILADRAGDDRYLVEAQGITQTFAVGQARCSNAGLGLLLDSGTGKDSYLLRAAPERPYVDEEGLKLGGLNVNGQGFSSIGGVSVLADGGGPHEMTLEAQVPEIAPTEERPVQQTPLIIPAGIANGNIGGVSAVLHGDGPANYTARVTMQSTWSGIVGLNAIAQAGVEGAALLRDEGGDDTYRLIAQNIAGRDGTDQPGPAISTMGLPNWAAATARGIASAGESGLALLHDVEGDDLYRAHVRAEAWAIDEAQAVATANPASESVQAATSGGLAVLRDEAGDDAYRTSVASHAEATSDTGDASATSGTVFTDAQGAAGPSGFQPGAALLLDQGGSDHYEAMSRSTADATSTGTTATGDLFSSAQGSVKGTGFALLFDSDEDEQDTFILVPAEPACMGTRGEGLWQDCDGAGFGYVDDDS